MEDSKLNQPIPVLAPGIVWLAVAGNIRLSLRHPRNTGPSRMIAANFADRIIEKLQQDGILSAEAVADFLRDDLRFQNQEGRIVRDLPWLKNKGTLGEALGIGDETVKACEELVDLAQREKWSLRRLIDVVNETLNLTDAEWTNFMYVLGWWDHARRG
jgi:hypothetical protein